MLKAEGTKIYNQLRAQLDIYCRVVERMYHVCNRARDVYEDQTAYQIWNTSAAKVQDMVSAIDKRRSVLSASLTRDDEALTQGIRIDFGGDDEAWTVLTAGLRMPYPKVLDLRKDKDLVILKYEDNAAGMRGWNTADEMLYRECLARNAKRPKDGVIEAKIRDMRARRRSNLQKVSRYEFKRGHYKVSLNAFNPSLDDIKKKYWELRRKISHARRNLRRPDGTPSRLPGAYRVGGVHMEPGATLEVSKARLRNTALRDKSPQQNDKHIGVELEFVSKANEKVIGNALLDAKLDSYVCLKHDGSLRVSKQGDTTHELTILVKEREYAEIIPKVCAVLKATGGYVNKSCGMHVHLDMRARKPEVAYDRLLKSLEILYRMTPPERRYNKFCLRNAPDMPFNANIGERYWAVNPQAYSRHKTIEIRLHSGSLNAVKVVNWVKLLLLIISTTNALAYRNPQRFIDGMKVPPELAAYIMLRVNKFDQEGEDYEDEHVKTIYSSGDAPQGPQCSCSDCRYVAGTEDTIDVDFDGDTNEVA